MKKSIKKFKLPFRANECNRFYGKSFLIIFRPGSLHSAGQGSLPHRHPASAVSAPSKDPYLPLTKPEKGRNKNIIAL